MKQNKSVIRCQTNFWVGGMIFLLSAVFAQESASLISTQNEIEIDGILSEEDWGRATPIENFIQYIPTEGGVPSGQTQVRFLQDEKNLYIGIHVQNADYTPQATITAREQINDDDQVGIYIDTVGDGRTGYIFYFNPYGIQQDIRYANGSWFVEWNTVYYSKGRPQKDGFTIEVAIPFRSLRYPEVESSDWRIMMTRKNPAKGAKYGWPKLKRTHPRMFMQAAPLQGVKPPPRGAGISLQPTLSALYDVGRDEDNVLVPRQEGNIEEYLRPSFDMLWGISSNTGMAATINPDFSQIEGDVRQLNLNQRFAFNYPERRPFFLDNIDSFSDQASSLYSRSIVNPLYGIKTAGRERNIDFGVLHSVDRSPQSSIHIDGSDGFSESDLDGNYALNNLARMRVDAFSQGYVGLSVSDKRIFTPEMEFGTGASSVGNLELSIPFSQSWVMNAYASASRTEGQDTSIGNQTGVSIVKSPPQGWGGSLSAYQSTPTYRQEMGFVTRSGVQNIRGGLSYGLPLANRSFSTTSVSGSFLQEYTGNTFVSVNLEENYRHRGIHSFTARVRPSFIRFSDVENMGYEAYFALNSRPSAQFRYSAYGSTGSTIDYGALVPASFSNGGVTLTMRPTKRITFSSNNSLNLFQQQDEDSSFAFNTYNRFVYQLSRDWGLRLVHQSTLYNEGAPRHNGSLLFTWLTTPGTEAYLGSTWSFEEEQLSSVAFFAKFTRLFRL